MPLKALYDQVVVGTGRARFSFSTQRFAARKRNFTAIARWSSASQTGGSRKLALTKSTRLMQWVNPLQCCGLATRFRKLGLRTRAS